MLSVGAILISIYVIVSNTFDKSLSIREHNEFKDQEKDKAQLRDTSLQRDLRRIEERIGVIEQTRPTVGELDARLRAESKSTSKEK
jgi:hypothetical protein